MSYLCVSRWLLPVLAGSFVLLPVLAEDPSPPRIASIGIKNAQQVLRFSPYPAAQEFKILRADALGLPFSVDATGVLTGYEWKSPLRAGTPQGFYRVEVTPISDESLAAATVLNRTAYGPTPDELERIRTIGVQAYIDEQLSPEHIQEDLDINKVVIPSDWQYVTASSTASSSQLYIYLNSLGEGYIDDIQLVAGNVAGTGPNLLRNGDFEMPLTTKDWKVASNHARSVISTDVKRSGRSSLRLVTTAPGSTDTSAIVQTITPALAPSPQRYTLSFWYLHTTNALSRVTVRLSGSQPSGSSPMLPPITTLTYGIASLADLSTWHILHAVQSKRQLLEVLTQFVDNHFVTYQDKSQDYLAGKVPSGADAAFATDLEYRELKKWREVLMNPNGTFYDLLKISTESPAMVIYLDTVASKKGAANENYARELMELFTMGVDNGYDQKDIEEMSRAWTGWRVDKLPVGQENNPFATPIPTASRNTTPGTWTLRFNSSASEHDATAKTIFPGKTIDARFGPPHAGKSYELRLPARTGTAGMQDGYDIISHLADLPYTQEYISVKLCRYFIHENFVHGVYDYTQPNSSAEAALIRDCMKAWDTPAADGRKGNLRSVLKVIFNSSTFRQHAASQQKVRNPLEFTVASVRALRAARPTGGFTSDCTGADLNNKMITLGMRLFNREEPDGWSEFGQDWINSSSLIERMRFVQERLRTASVADPVGLLKLKLPSTQWRDAGLVTDYFLSILFPAEGKANLTLDRATALTFLNTADNGTTPSLFNALDPNSSTYGTRVRGMVAYLMGLPRFQEQ